MNKHISYNVAGVDLVAGDNASKLMFLASKETWANREGLPGSIIVARDTFSGLRFMEASMFADAMVGLNFDGVGTKIEVAERVGDHTTIAFDLFAMVCDDAARAGGEPIAIGSILDCSKVEMRVIEQLAQGMVSAAKIARVAVINGEIAELGERVKGYSNVSYNWGAAIIWLGRRERMISGHDISVGQSIVAVREKGFRSNGLSLVRKAFREAYGEEWHLREFSGSSLGRAVLEPSIIFTPGIVRLTGGYNGNPKACVAGIAHVTGGGIPGKLGRLLTGSQYGAVLENLFEPCDVMLECQAVAGVDDREAYRAWNMGNGLLIITSEPDIVVSELIAEGFEAQVAGKIESRKDIVIKNKAVNASNNTWLAFEE